jgi:hypothetical protein
MYPMVDFTPETTAPPGGLRRSIGKRDRRGGHLTAATPLSELESYVGLQRAGRELGCLLVVMAVVTLEMVHIAHTPGLTQKFLFSSDSLTLALLRESIARHEPLHPVMSSQLLIFPEAVLYLLSSLLTTSVRASLVMNAYVNVLLLYVLLRGISHFLTRRDRVAAATCCLISTSYTLLENSASKLIASFYLFNTYYSGVVIFGLFSVLIALWQLSARSTARKHVFVTTGAILLIGLAAASDALVFVEVSVPLLATIAVLAAARAVRLRKAMLLAATQMTAAFLGYLLRIPLHRLFGFQNYAGYIRYGRATRTFVTLMRIAGSIISTGGGLLEVAAILSVVGWAAVLSWRCLFRYRPIGDSPPAPTALVAVFSLLSPLAIVGATVLTGHYAIRYLIPVAIFPFTALLVVFNCQIGWARRLARFHPALVGAVALIVVGSFSAARIQPLVSSVPSPDARCLSAVLGGRPADGLAGYWTSRPLDLYGQHDERVLQVTTGIAPFPNGLTPFLWLVNAGEYENKHFTFVLVDRRLGLNDLTVANVETLGRPSAIEGCPTFWVYRYEPGSTAYATLNSEMTNALTFDLKRQTA